VQLLDYDDTIERRLERLRMLSPELAAKLERHRIYVVRIKKLLALANEVVQSEERESVEGQHPAGT
jgi:hypothetical protein